MMAKSSANQPYTPSDAETYNIFTLKIKQEILLIDVD